MLLHRINPSQNEFRFYLVVTGPSLFDPYAVIRVWGRIGGHQREMITSCASAEEAERLAGQLIQRKMKRGYVPIKDEEF